MPRIPVVYTTGELMSWLDANGTEWPLNGDAYLFLDNPGRKGFKGLPPYAAAVLDTPLVDGDVVRFVLAQARGLEVHLLIKGSNVTDYEQIRSALQNAMNPKLGDGRFRCTRADGVQRDVFCRYESGFSGDESWGAASSIHQHYLLKFLAHDPYFYDTIATSQTFTSAVPSNFFPITPIRLSSASIGSGFSIFNGGDVESYPVFTISGPGTNPTLTNTTTGKSISATIALLAGQSLIIDTQAKTVKREDGSNQFSVLSFASVLWTLAQGQNAITLGMSGTGAGSQITVSYKQRWNSL